MTELQLDGSNWKTTDDFYDAFFRAVGAPSWHGRNFNALRDSIITGQINKIELPYTIHISGLGNATEGEETGGRFLQPDKRVSRGGARSRGNLQGVAGSLSLPLP